MPRWALPIFFLYLQSFSMLRTNQMPLSKVSQSQTHSLEKIDFKKKMKSHYAGEFKASALLKQNPRWDDDEDDEK